jgi:glycerol-3-phosphate responsive antiterminator
MPIVGIATIKAETMKGARKEPHAEIIRIFLLAEDVAMLR